MYRECEIKGKKESMTLHTGDTILIDTCSLIEGDRYKFLFSNLKCLSTAETYKELSRVAAEKLRKHKTISNISIKIVKETPDVRNEAKKLYRRYGLVWGVSYVDCVNLAQAKVNKEPLMTCDRALIKVAEKEGVKVVPMLLNGKNRISIIISKTVCENVSSKYSLPVTKLEESKTNDGRM
jgi:predicted nucleic acid-binding protein